MTWFRVDDAFAEHPKLEALEALGPETWSRCIAVWIAAGCYCARHTTDGAISRARLGRITPLGRDALAAAEHLVEAGLWDATDDGFVFHDWSDYQPTKAELEADRAAKTERQKRWRQRRRAEKLAQSQGVDASTNASHDASRDGPQDALRDALRDASRDTPRDASVDGRGASVADGSVDGAPSRPVPTRPVPPTDVGGGARAGATPPPPEEGLNRAVVWARFERLYLEATGESLPGLATPVQLRDVDRASHKLGSYAAVLRELEAFCAWAAEQPVRPPQPWLRFLDEVGGWEAKPERTADRERLALERAAERDPKVRAERDVKAASSRARKRAIAEERALVQKLDVDPDKVVPIADVAANVLAKLKGATA